MEGCLETEMKEVNGMYFFFSLVIVGEWYFLLSVQAQLLILEDIHEIMCLAITLLNSDGACIPGVGDLSKLTFITPYWSVILLF